MVRHSQEALSYSVGLRYSNLISNMSRYSLCFIYCNALDNSAIIVRDSFLWEGDLDVKRSGPSLNCQADSYIMIQFKWSLIIGLGF